MSVLVLWPVTSDQAGSPHRLRLWQQWPRVLGPLPVSSTTAPLPDHILVHCINQTKPGPRLANIGHLLLFGKGVPTMPPQSVSPCPPGPRRLQEAGVAMLCVRCWPLLGVSASPGTGGGGWARCEGGHWPLENTDPVSCCPPQQTHCSTPH